MTVDEWGVRVRGGMRLTMVEVGQMLSDLAAMTADRDDLLAYYGRVRITVVGATIHMGDFFEEDEGPQAIIDLIARIEARRKEQGK